MHLEHPMPQAFDVHVVILGAVYRQPRVAPWARHDKEGCAFRFKRLGDDLSTLLTPNGDYHGF
jgi:hypothetical protein